MFISGKLEHWAPKHYVELKFIQPGKPNQKGLIDRLHGTRRKECLNQEWFVRISRLNEQVQKWWHDYNSARPHSSIGYLIPDEFE